jgi:hypothetical protein
MMNAAICVQAFNKADTIIATLDSLATAKHANEFDLIIVQDGIQGNKFQNRYQDEHSRTTTAIESWLSRNKGIFKSETFTPLDIGKGTSGTARILIDQGFERHDWVIFSEDDLIFEADALAWFKAMITHSGFLRDDVWAIAGEARHFDSKGAQVSEAFRQEALHEAREQDLASKYCYFGWLPSSCFATNLEKWSDFGETRGLPRGPKMVNDRCLSAGKKSLWPIIARCRDVGMHHEIGYSISIHKTPDRVPQKSNYVTSGNFPPTTDFLELTESDKIYQKFTTKATTK